MPLPKDPKKAEEYRQRQRVAMLAYFSNPANKEKSSIAAKKMYAAHPELKVAVGDFHRGKTMSPSSRLKMSISKSGYKNANFGKPLSEERKKQIGVFHSTFRHSAETKRMMSITRKGTGGQMRGKRHTPETKRKIGVALKGRVVSDATRLKKHIATCGEKNYNWKGGVSFAPYCEKFNREFKRRVRRFYNDECVECGVKSIAKKFHVHHVNFNKQTCCDNTQPLFVLLCPSCHSKTQHNRIFWEYWFTEMIMRHYKGECYLPKGSEING
jgi:hypothetical protein